MATRSEAARRHASHYLAVLERLGTRNDGALALDVEREWPQIRRARQWAAAAPDVSGRTSLDRGFTRSAPAALKVALATAQERGGSADAAAPPASREDRAGDLRLALSFSRHTLAISIQDGDTSGQVHDYATVGFIHHLLGDRARAAECIGRAWEISRAIPDPQGIARELARLGGSPAEPGWLQSAYSTLAGAIRLEESADSAGFVPREEQGAADPADSL